MIRKMRMKETLSTMKTLNKKKCLEMIMIFMDLKTMHKMIRSTTKAMAMEAMILTMS